jgi:hypothetical protein
MAAPGCCDNGCEGCDACFACECQCCEGLKENRNTIASVAAGILVRPSFLLLPSPSFSISLCLDTHTSASPSQPASLEPSLAPGRVQFAIGWWFMIDATVNDHIEKKHQAIGTMSTLGMFM